MPEGKTEIKDPGQEMCIRDRPYGVYGILICIGLLAVLLIMVRRMGYGDAGEYDEDRNFSYSAKRGV